MADHFADKPLQLLPRDESNESHNSSDFESVLVLPVNLQARVSVNRSPRDIMVNRINRADRLDFLDAQEDLVDQYDLGQPNDEDNDDDE